MDSEAANERGMPITDEDPIPKKVFEFASFASTCYGSLPAKSIIVQYPRDS